MRQCDKRQNLICIHEALSEFKGKLQNRIKSRGSWWTSPLSFKMLSAFRRRLCGTPGYYPLSHVFISLPLRSKIGGRTFRSVGCVMFHGDTAQNLGHLKLTQQSANICCSSCRLRFQIVLGLTTSYQSYCLWRACPAEIAVMDSGFKLMRIFQQEP